MQNHINNKIYHIEILTPKQNSETLETDLERFAEKFRKVMDAGYTACITDNPMGLISFQATDVITELDLPVLPEQLVIHLNTFHAKQELDQILTAAADMGAKYLLVVTGDGGERQAKLDAAAIGFDTETATSVELLQYIAREYPATFNCGAAFNPYEPEDHELDKMRRKIGAGAEFIITQPVIGKDERMNGLKEFGLPVIVNAWMSKKLLLLSQCVGYEIPEDTPYDPIENLKELIAGYPDFGLYLALLGFKTQYPLLKEL